MAIRTWIGSRRCPRRPKRMVLRDAGSVRFRSVLCEPERHGLIVFDIAMPRQPKNVALMGCVGGIAAEALVIVIEAAGDIEIAPCSAACKLQPSPYSLWCSYLSGIPTTRRWPTLRDRSRRRCTACGWFF